MSLVIPDKSQYPLVTIAIPTFNRAALLKRAINCATRQDYSNIEILVSDNASPDVAVQQFLNDASARHSNIRAFVQAQNQGSRENFLFLLREAKGKYFMWLADDDEISENYASALVQVLEENSDTTTAMGQWILVGPDGSYSEMVSSDYPDKSTRRRLLRYCWRSNDAFFYGLHRTDALRNAEFNGYWWPNRKILLNWAYVYLFDMVAQGRVVLSPNKSARWINHYYSEKLYPAEHEGVRRLMSYSLRRLNIYILYFSKALRWREFVTAATLIVIAPLAWIRDVRGPFRAFVADRLREVIDS